ncbi:unnamed protein product [Schistocephalus solidus]|uniref:Rho-GAP domain-containing protein n=1 Tax=Schistocephalus solidus TaxID=70667 RepID=A0A183SH68_SCHSO|nr:unnamed protein product [Schistocephalus solidus]
MIPCLSVCRFLSNGMMSKIYILLQACQSSIADWLVKDCADVAQGLQLVRVMHRLGQSTHNMGRSSVLEGGFPARVPSCFSNFRNIFLRSPFRSTATLGTSLTCDPATIPEHENSGLEASKQRELMRISSTRRLSSSSYSSSSSSKSFFSATKPATNILRISTAEANRQPVPTPEASCSKHIRTAIPDPVFALFAFLARQGVHVTDLFRRPGNITQMKTISSQLAVGEPVDWSIYNIYTVANVAKRFLLSVPGGLLGDQNERKLLATAVSYCLPCHEQQQEEEVVEEPPKQTHLRPHHHQHLHHPHLTHYHHLRASAGVSEGSLSVPSKLMHAPGFRPLEPVTGSKSLCISPSFTDRSGFLTDFGLGPPLPFERTQMDSFVGILESLPKASRELVVLIFGILHSMVRHASALFITGCPSCSSSLDLHSNSLGDLGGRDAVTGSPTSGVSTPTVRTLAEAVSKSIVGALIHTCPLSVDMVDRASQVVNVHTAPLTGTQLSPVAPRSWVLPSGHTPGNRHDRRAKPDHGDEHPLLHSHHLSGDLRLPAICNTTTAPSTSVGDSILTCPHCDCTFTSHISLVGHGAISVVLQTLLLRYSLLGDSATSFYTDFMLGRVRPKSAPDVQSVPMANVISQFIIPRVPAHKVRSRKRGGDAPAKENEADPVQDYRNHGSRIDNPWVCGLCHDTDVMSLEHSGISAWREVMLLRPSLVPIQFMHVITGGGVAGGPASKVDRMRLRGRRRALNESWARLAPPPLARRHPSLLHPRDQNVCSITKVAAFASVASRLAHLTDSFGGGGGNARRHWWRVGSGGTTVPDSSKTIPNNSSFSSSVPPAFSLQQTLVQPSNIPIKPYETPSTPFVLTEPAPPLPQRLQMPVTASVETPDQITDPPASHAEASYNFCPAGFFHRDVYSMLIVSASVRSGILFDVCNAGETEVEALHRPVLARSSSRCSYSRYRAVHRRQLDAMLRRTAWFLDPNTSRQSVSSGPTGGCNDRLGTNPRVFISHEPTSIDVCCCRPSETTHSVALPPLISITQTSTVSLLDFGRDRDEGSCGPGSYREFAASASDLEAPTSAWAGPGFQNSPDILTFTGQHLYLGTNAHSISMATVRSAPTRHASPAASSDYRLCPDPDHCTRPILAMTSQRASFPEKSQNPT